MPAVDAQRFDAAARQLVKRRASHGTGAGNNDVPL
jgi:hypothetical protein